MNKKKVIATILIIVAIGLLVAGGIILYQNYSNKNRIVTSFNELKTALEETFNLSSTEAENSPIKQTVTGTMTLNINPLLGSSTDGSDVIIGNLNNSAFNYEYRLDTEEKKMYLNGSLLLNASEIMGINFYQADDISYILLRNILDRYIMIEDNDIFSYLDNNNLTSDDINYIYDKITDSLGNNITKDDIIVSNEDGTKKISLELNQERLSEISNAIVEDLQKDDKAQDIIGNAINSLGAASPDEVSTTTNPDSSLSYSIYLEKNDIVTYEFTVDDGTDNYSIVFNTGSEKSIAIEENGTETLKGVITNNNNGTTVELSSDSTNIGNITISSNTVSVNIIDESTDATLTANLTSSTENNVVTTTFNMGMTSSGINLDIISLTDVKTITENTADFSNINTTNNIDVNSLTETDITTIENNLMTILYNFMGITI